jgi:nitronate monooxygenase
LLWVEDRHVALTTAFTRLLSVEHPVVLAPMGGTAGGALAAAVSSAGGLGLLGAGGGSDRRWLDRELSIVTERTGRPWGVGFLTWGLDITTLDRVLGAGPAAIMLSFGDPVPFAGRIKQAGVPLIVQVTDLDEARQAIDVGADVVVAQGSEAGGHGRNGRSTMSFVPVVADLAGVVPVLAAGGIADGRGIVAALALGAAGVVVGSRFQATQESLAAPEVVKAIVDSCGSQTERTRILDIARSSQWPPQYTARVLANRFLDQWRGQEDALRSDAQARLDYDVAVSRGDLEAVSVWCGQAIDLIDDVPPAAELVTRMIDHAQRIVAGMSNLDT